MAVRVEQVGLGAGKEMPGLPGGEVGLAGDLGGSDQEGECAVGSDVDRDEVGIEDVPFNAGVLAEFCFLGRSRGSG